MNIKSQAKMQAQKAMKKAAKQAAKQAVKKGLRLIATKIGIALAPIIIIILVVILLVMGIIGFTYTSMPEEGVVNGTIKTAEDEVSIKKIQTQVENANNSHLYVTNIAPEINKPLYPNTYTKALYLADQYRQDQTQTLKWEVVQSIALYQALVDNKAKITDESRENIAKELEPYFYYKPSKTTVETTIEKKDSKGNTYFEKQVNSQDVYLLVESNTLYGWYQYSYETVQKKSDGTTITYERLKDIKTLDNWGRLNKTIKKYIKPKDDKDLTFARMAILENAKAYRNKKENLEWLLKRNFEDEYISSSMIPPELKAFYQEAETKYKIPWWFIAAVSFKESSFNPYAENTSTGAYGLMQLLPENWDKYSKKLGFDPKIDKDNPRAQILTGASMLANYGLDKVDWNNQNDIVWEKQTLPGLEKYGGFISVPVTKKVIYGADVDKWCEDEYASPIWSLAIKFKSTNNGTWPVPSSHVITSFFNEDRGEKGRHHGLDIGANEGSNIISASSGVVTSVGWDNPNNHKEGYGYYITIRDGIHLYYYAHLRVGGVKVKAGDNITTGQLIAEVGNTGNSSGPHLHFGVQDLQKDIWIDPLYLLSE